MPTLGIKHLSSFASGRQELFRLHFLARSRSSLLHASRSPAPPGSHGCPFHPLPGPEDSCESYRHALGRDKLSYEVPRSHGDEERFFVEGLSFPDAGFTGLVSFHVTLLDDSNEVGGGQAERVTKGLHSWERQAPPVRETPGFSTIPLVPL